MSGEDVGSKADLLLPAKSAFPPSLAVRCCRQVPKEGSTALLDRYTPGPKHSKNAQTENCCLASVACTKTIFPCRIADGAVRSYERLAFGQHFDEVFWQEFPAP